MNPVIELKNIYVKYEKQSVLEDISFVVEENDFFTIVGPNGGGKTTLLKVLLGLMKPVKGSVKIGDGKNNASELIGYVPQFSKSDRSFPIDVWETVLLGRLNKQKWFSRFNSEDKRLTEHVLDVVGMLDLKNAQIGELSEGQRQRVFIARALVSEPEILLLDEPTTSVDECIKHNIYDLLNELRKKMTIVLVTHDLGAVSSYITKLACLNRKLYFHNNNELNNEDFEEAYGCPFELVAHGVPHRVYHQHNK
jgi:zinc transport system ATP-binding protein